MSVEDESNLSLHYEDPALPPEAWHEVTKRRLIFWHKVVRERLPQYYPREHRGEDFSFAHLINTGAIKPDARTVEISTGADALALRSLAERAHRGETQPPQNLS